MNPLPKSITDGRTKQFFNLTACCLQECRHPEVIQPAVKLALRSSPSNLLSSGMLGNSVNETRIATVIASPANANTTAPQYERMKANLAVRTRGSWRLEVKSCINSLAGRFNVAKDIYLSGP
jgi:hypothetical protein